MGKTKKLIELDNELLKVLEKEAKNQKRSLKNYLEYMIEDRALELSVPSEEYMTMMDDMLKRLEEGTLETIPYEEIKRKYGMGR